jgi:glutamate synthase (ferredoxin)
MSKLLHKAVGLGGKGAGGQDAFDAYTAHFEQSPVHVLRDMLELKGSGQPIPIEEVEPAAGGCRAVLCRAVLCRVVLCCAGGSNIIARS